jgi:hypothetical protein
MRAVTFDTALAPISVADAELLIRAYERRHARGGCEGAPEEAAQDAAALGVLEASLAACMASLGAGPEARCSRRHSCRRSRGGRPPPCVP